MTALVLALSIGCDGGAGDPDAGDQPDAASQPDSGPVEPDRAPPRVTSTLPRNGEELVPRTEPIEIRFDEPIDGDSGAIVATSGGMELALGERTLEREGDVLRVAPAEAWPGGARVDVRIEGFEDRAGNAQEEPHDLVFHTNDEGAPSVVETTPAEGATEVDAGLERITIRFSEPMNPVLGTLSLEGGPGALGEPAWSSATELRLAVSGLDAGTSYRVLLDGFEDRSGNALDPVPTLADGTLDFATAPDTTAPTVIDSSPTNGQVDVAVSTLRTIEVTFSEPMDTSLRDAPLTGDEAATTLTGNWSPDGKVLTFSVAGGTASDAENRLDLSEMRDRHGNALDPEVNLTAGELVFTTSSADSQLPAVVFSTPLEGAIDVPARTAEITVVFSEAMDRTQVTADLTSAAGAETLTGSWNTAGTKLTLATAGLSARTAFTLALGAFTDMSGNALDTTHPYLGDGALDFTSGAPTGESCADPLTVAEAVSTGTGVEWTLEPGIFVAADDPPSCSTAAGHDGVLVYEKTSADLAGGGRALRITASSPDAFNGVMLEVFRDVCDSEAVGGGLAAREVCLTGRRKWEQHLDVPAGTYYLHVASDNAAFLGATVRIEEVDAIPEGESCADPFDSTSAIYSSPSAGEHVWVVPHGSGRGVDYGSTNSGEGSISCYSSAHGPDAVVRVDKARSGSILDVTVDPFPADSLGTDRRGVVVDVLDACDPEAGTSSVMCAGRINSAETFQITGGAGDYYLWLAANNPEVDHVRTTLRVREIDPAPGETCATAIPITPGTSVPVTPASSEAFFAPSCVPTEAGITWYRFTTTREVSVVSLEATEPAALALIDPSTNTEIGCVADASEFGIPRRVAPGTEVCVAVPTSPAITGFSIRELDWRGVTGTGTDLGISRPVNESGTGISITGETFLEVTPTTLYLGVSPNSSISAAIVSAPRSGGVIADRRLIDRYTFGNAAVAIGEALFSVEETNRPSRIHRLIDATGNLSATVWDSGSVYATPDIDAMTYLASEDLFFLANDGTRTSSTHVPTTFYSATASAPGPVTILGENAELRDVVAIAADATWIYVIGATGPPSPTSAVIRTVHRVPRADVTAVPEPLAPRDLVGFSTTNGSMVLDHARDILYFRSTSVPRGVHAIFDASTASPVYVGPVFVRGGSGDHGLALDPAIPALFVFETETDSTGTFVEVR